MEGGEREEGRGMFFQGSGEEGVAQKWPSPAYLGQGLCA